jgi:hypothetical protein
MKYTFPGRSLWRRTSSIARRMWPYSKRTGGMDYVDDEVSGKSTEIQGANATTYKNPTKVLSVDMDAELKAEHCVEPASEMQF